jgi:hypothetical protein
MIGANRVEILIQHKEKLYEKSLNFAKSEAPDYIIMKEAVMCFDKIIIAQIEKANNSPDALTESDKKYLF